MLPEDGQLQNLTEIIMEETGASGDCDPIETRGFISSEIAQELESDAIMKGLEQKQPNLDQNDDQLHGTTVVDWPILVCP